MPELSDEVYVDDHSVACDGGCGPLGHPRVYLAIDRSGRVECPYCSRRFIYRPAGQAHETVDPPPAEEETPPAT